MRAFAGGVTDEVRHQMQDFVVARNPDEKSSLPFLIHLPLPDGERWFKAKESWPRSASVFCLELERAPQGPLVVLERVPVISCRLRGKAIDLILNRGLNKRSQFIFVRHRGRGQVFWQTPKSAQAARPGLRIPSGRVRDGQRYYVDSRERYGYTFSAHADLERRPLPAGDYAAMIDDKIVAVVERKTIEDFKTSLVDASLSFEMAELAAMPLAAVVVEGRYSALLRDKHIRSGYMPELIARLAARYPNVPIVFLETRRIAEEWVYRFLRVAYANDGELPFSAREAPDGHV